MKIVLSMLVVLVVWLSTAGVRYASADPPPCEDALSTYAGDSRVQAIDIEGRRVLVLLPEGYAHSGRRYPSLYLLHGSENTPDAWLVRTDLMSFTGNIPEDQRAIVVLPDGGLEDWWVDWRDGSVRDETFFTETIVPAIDARYRTDTSARAIAGFSLGGYAAANLAARHPDLFAAIGSFSGGPFDLEHPGGLALAWAAPEIEAYCDEQPERSNPFALFGDPVTDGIRYREASPVHLARNFKDKSVSLYVGNGVPCEDDPPFTEAPPENPAWWIEAGARDQADRFSAALAESGVDHSYEVDDCGVHTYHRAEARLHDWWPDMIKAVEAPAPASFSFRNAEHTFAVRGWTFTADAMRAREFLDVSDASCAGVVLTGSGAVTVRTSACFKHKHVVGLEGAHEASVLSSTDGSISFTVDLGPPHQHQQYTPAATALEALRGYWTTRSIAFRDPK